MNDKTCQTCLHFHQHYTLKCGKLLRVFYGHCVFPTAKPKRPFSKACENYIYCLPDEDAYADKKYLLDSLNRGYHMNFTDEEITLYFHQISKLIDERWEK